MDRAAGNHYSTMTTSEIMALAPQIEGITAKDCVLFLWATGAMCDQAFDLMRAWGFKYKSQYVWIKDRAATGFWNRNRHELLLIGTKGNIPTLRWVPSRNRPSSRRRPGTPRSRRRCAT
jgi:N6-adenosine-specific RNA methylase IME4